MKNSFELFQNLKEKHLIQTLNPNFNEIFYDFSFFFIDEDKINENLKKQRLIIIDEYEHTNAKYYIICFKKTLIIMNEKDIKNNIEFFKIIQNSNIYLFKDQTSRNIFGHDRTNDPNKYNFTLFDSIKKEEILKFQKEFLIINRNIIDFWKTISRSISGFLIEEAYENTFIDRVMKTKKLISKKEEKEMNHNEYISIKTINSTATSIIEKIYHLKERKYYIKKKKRRTVERTKLSQREYYNYMQFHHPFQLQFYSAIEEESQETLILEYIEGETLENIQKMRLTIADKYKIIFEIIVIINYYHHHRFVYRDLKPNNVILDRNKTIILIDLDRMISEDEIANKNEEDMTIIIHQYSSPELKEGKLISYSTDIYSLGMLMFYLIFENEPSTCKIEETKCQPILELIKKCTRENPNERPNIIEILKYFYVEFFSKVRNELIETDMINNIKNIDNDIYIEYLVFICESQNPYSLYQLGEFYRKGNIFKNNLKIAHHYYTLAADKNQVDSQLYLGEYHFDNKNDSEHINKSLYYFTQASNQNYLKAHFYLGLIYLTKIKTNGHIDKAIFYFTLAANQNNAISQYCLGIIYFRDYDLKHFDIKKAIYYFKLAAKQNYIKSMIMLGNIYLEGKHVSKDINKAIEYFTQAANKNNINAQMDLGHFYIFGRYVKRDIDKGIYFLSLAANQNIAEAQYELGIIYIKPEYQRQNINKAMLYFTLAAKNNHEGAQKALLSFFMGGKYAPQDIEKATSLLSSFTGADHQTARLFVESTLLDNNLLPQNINKNNIEEMNDDQISTIMHFGYLFLQGIQYKQNIQAAIYYFSLAANKNNAVAQYVLGIIYQTVNYSCFDINKAIYYYKLSADQNYPEAQNNLAVIYCEGKYIQRDINKAIHYFTLASNNNFAKAQFCLGFLYYDGLLVQKNINKTIHYFTLAGNQNDLLALTYLSIIFYNGKDIQKDFNKAIQYLSLPLKHNVPAAMFIYGVINLTGDHVEQDINKGLYYLTLSAEKNCAFSQFYLGLLYMTGEYIPEDINKAIHYFTMAAENKHKYAYSPLGLIYLNEKYMKTNINKAIHYLKLGSDIGDEKSQYYLGRVYWDKKYNAYNIEKAIKYFTLSAQNGYSKAQLALGTIYYDLKDMNKTFYYFHLSAKIIIILLNFMLDSCI